MMTPILLALVLCTSPVNMSLPNRTAQIRVAKVKKVRMQFSRATLLEVVKWFSKRTDRNFIVPDHLHDRRINIISGSPVSLEDAYQAFQDALRLEGLEVDQQGSFLLIVPMGSVEKMLIEVPEATGCAPLPGVRPSGKHTWVIQREVISRLMSEKSKERTPRIVPNFKDGKPYGLKLFALGRCSLLARLGFENGDVIYRINRIDIEGPDQVMAIQESVWKASTVEVQLRRDGEEIKLTYRIEPEEGRKKKHG
jgi:hypothetical protein